MAATLAASCPRRVRTGQNTEECSASTHLDEKTNEAVDPDPQGHELAVPQGQAHHRQPAQLSPGPEAEGKSYVTMCVQQN